MNRKLIFFTLIILLLIILTGILLPVPLPVSISNKQAFHDSVQMSYSGEGTLFVCSANGDTLLSGENVIIMNAPLETAADRERTVLIYPPPDFDRKEVYPVLYLLHGFAAHPTFWIENLIPSIERAVSNGELPPLIAVIPDGSLSGNGTDDPDTSIDERGGCWYINSNRTRYEDFLLEDLPAFVRTIAIISDDPDNIVIAGSSMGGFGAAYYALRYPERFRNAGLFYPALDLRYAVRGNRLKAYEADKYKPITRDNPFRIVNKAAGSGILGLTDKWCFYPVFNSDSAAGVFWTEDLPVWQRQKDVNPADILLIDNPDLTGSRFFIQTGSSDDFNFDDHQKVVLPMIRQAGGTVEPQDTIIPDGRHNWTSIEPSVPDFIDWLADTFE